MDVEEMDEGYHMGGSALLGIMTMGLRVVPYILLKPTTFSLKDLKPLKKICFVVLR